MPHRGKVGRPVCQSCFGQTRLNTIEPKNKDICLVSFICEVCETVLEFEAVLRDHVMIHKGGEE